MKISELQAFVTVVETGNMTLAAERLNRVQSSISHRIQSLENNLDTLLLDRKTGGCIPTKQGLILYEYALKILKLAEDCKKNIANTKENYANINVGIIECLPPYIITSLINLGQELGLNINITIGNTLSLLNAYDKNEFDIVIIGSGFSNEKHTTKILLASELVIATDKSHPTITNIANLDGKTFLVSSKQCATSKRNFEMLFSASNIKPERVIECGSYPVLFSNIALGKGIALVLRCSISNEIKNKIKLHKLDKQFNEFKIELVHHTNYSYFDINKLINMITSVFQDPRLSYIGY